MQLFINTLSGATSACQVSASDSVNSLKAAIEASQGIPASQQGLLYAGRPLEGERCLADYNIQDEACVDLVLRLCGGGKKRKKKVYTTPKKIKHKRKKVKLAVLQYYQVDDDGNVKRLRRECPHCGPSVFMAMHKKDKFNPAPRQYCGKCHETYTLEN